MTISVTAASLGAATRERTMRMQAPSLAKRAKTRTRRKERDTAAAWQQYEMTRRADMECYLHARQYIR